MLALVSNLVSARYSQVVLLRHSGVGAENRSPAAGAPEQLQAYFSSSKRVSLHLHRNLYRQETVTPWGTNPLHGLLVWSVHSRLAHPCKTHSLANRPGGSVVVVAATAENASCDIATGAV